MLKLLSIAGSDPSGGAGIQMDLKVFSVLGDYGMAVPTALTVQNTKGVYETFHIPERLILKQIEAVLNDIKVDGVKIGMLGTSRLAKPLSELLRGRVNTVVYDPVITSTTGSTLTEGEASWLLELAGICSVITPNLEEFKRLTGKSSIEEGVKSLRDRGVNCSVVITGADSGKDCVIDVIVTDSIKSFQHDKIDIPEGTHGTGCAFSSALLHYICAGLPLEEAYLKARSFVKEGLKGALKVGGGIVPVRPEANTARDAERFRVLERLKRALGLLKETPGIHRLIPEVQSNLGECIPNPKGIEDVAAFPGRIVRVKDSIATVACPEFGASSHVARIILAANRYDPEIRACMNVRYSTEIVERAKEKFKVSSFSRKEEPEEVKEREGSTLDWGTEVAIKKACEVPDIIYDTGDVGKEPMVRVLGRDAIDVVRKVIGLLQLVGPDR